MTVLAATATLAACGAVLAVVTVIHAASPGATVSVAPVHASFGPLTVERVARVRIATSHNHPGAPDAELRVVVRVENRRAGAVPYSPGQFRLRVSGQYGTVSPVRPTRDVSALAGGAVVRQRLAFRVIADASPYELVFDDLRRSVPIRMPIRDAALGAAPSRTHGHQPTIPKVMSQ